MIDSLTQEKFEKLASLLNQGKAKEALSYLLEHREELFYAKPVATMKANLELRFILSQFDEAYEDLSYYSNTSYISQEVEEYLQKIPSLIRSAERAELNRRGYDEEELGSLLDSEDDLSCFGAIAYLKEKDITPYLSQLKSLISSSRHHDIRLYALLTLVSHKTPGLVHFESHGVNYDLDPSQIKPPFSSSFYRKVKEVLQKEKDSSLSKVSLSLLDQYELSSYPRQRKEKEAEAYAKAFLLLGKRYLCYEEKEEQSVSILAESIEKELQEYPPLAI